MNCTKCGGETELKSGVSKKNGKPWQGFKCLNKDCGNMDFVEDRPGTRTEIRETGPAPIRNIIAPANSELRERTMIMSYAKDVVVKQIEVGIAGPGDASNQIIAIYRALCVEIFNPLK